MKLTIIVLSVFWLLVAGCCFLLSGYCFLHHALCALHPFILILVTNKSSVKLHVIICELLNLDDNNLGEVYQRFMEGWPFRFRILKKASLICLILKGFSINPSMIPFGFTIFWSF
jgi:hypothetical protein